MIILDAIQAISMLFILYLIHNLTQIIANLVYYKL